LAEQHSQEHHERSEGLPVPGTPYEHSVESLNPYNLLHRIYSRTEGLESQKRPDS